MCRVVPNHRKLTFVVVKWLYLCCYFAVSSPDNAVHECFGSEHHWAGNKLNICGAYWGRMQHWTGGKCTYWLRPFMTLKKGKSQHIYTIGAYRSAANMGLVVFYHREMSSWLSFCISFEYRYTSIKSVQIGDFGYTQYSKNKTYIHSNGSRSEM